MYTQGSTTPIKAIVLDLDGEEIVTDVVAVVNGEAAAGGIEYAGGRWIYTPTAVETGRDEWDVRFTHADAVGGGPLVQIVTTAWEPPGGTEPVTITITVGGQPVEAGTTVAIHDRNSGALQDRGSTTGAAGGHIVTLSADPNTWELRVYKSGTYESHTADITVEAGGKAVAVAMVALPAITPPVDPLLSRIRIYTRLGGVYKSGMLVQARQTGEVGGEVNIGDGTRIREFRSIPAGYVQFDVVRNAPHEWRMGRTGPWTPFTPTDATVDVNASAGDEF
jgi:hypothetical protein